MSIVGVEYLKSISISAFFMGQKFRLNVNSWGRIPEKYFYLGFFYGSKILGKKVPETIDFEQHK